MIQKTPVTASLSELLLMGAPVILQAQTAQGQQGQQAQQATKSVSGKGTSIGDQGHSFAVEVETGGMCIRGGRMRRRSRHMRDCRIR
jgi:hypothetical protein